MERTMYLYYIYLQHLEDAELYKCPQATIQVGTGNPLPWHNPSECIWIVPGTVNDDFAESNRGKFTKD